MLSSDELAQFEKLLKPLKEGQERIEKTQREQGTAIHEQGTAIAQIKTAVEAVAAGQQDVRATIKNVEATVAEARAGLKTDILTIDKKLVRKVQSHENRIEALEEKTETPNPNKH